MSEIVAERIKQRRKELGLSQEDLAKKLEVERSTVSKWESGKTNLKQSMVVKLANALDCSPTWIAGLQDYYSPFKWIVNDDGNVMLLSNKSQKERAEHPEERYIYKEIELDKTITSTGRTGDSESDKNEVELLMDKMDVYELNRAKTYAEYLLAKKIFK